MNRPVLVIGAGGQARVLVDALTLSGVEVVGLLDVDEAKQGSGVLGIKVIGGDDAVEEYAPNKVFLVNGIGSVKSMAQRRKVYERYKSRGYGFASVVHPSAVIARDIVLGEGTQILAGAVVQAGCVIGENVIINTRASVDHDCRIGPHVQIAPGATLSGKVEIGEGTHVGTGAVVIQGIAIGKNCVVGAGAVVISDVPDGKTVLGVPARIKES
ncbi:MAG: acetyltransferase [Deltaproteobacteria bacterium]|nr:acetyltransferase [Deltaproteobacteria bacterium]MBW2018614.1 acetyltransferase [Deltaproteobacteria bacterium]MBW2073880.1 acetyltransferase [Deltaproteobacteria bacterium]